MPVTTRVAPVEVMPAPAVSTHNSTSLLQRVCPEVWQNVLHGNEDSVLGSSFVSNVNVKIPYFGVLENTVNGFVGTILDAYRNHNHVVLRPDDVWFAILIQFNFYVNRHAEEMREHFVDHKGKVKLKVESPKMDFASILRQMTNLIHDKIKDADFREWVMPDFTTTTVTDKVTASIIMMGTMQKYFAYFADITCGIPSVTLLGEESDWQKILARIEFLSRFAVKHPELRKWKLVLEAVVRKIVQTFKAPDSPDVVHFWQCAVHAHRDDYYGDKPITGWVLAFCFWDTEGKLLAGRYQWEAKALEEKSDWGVTDHYFGSLSWNNVPAAYIHVPVHVNHFGDKFMTKAVAGFVGYEVLDSEQIFPLTRRGTKSKSMPDDGLLAKKGIPRRLFMSCFHFSGKHKKRWSIMGKDGKELRPAGDDSKRSSSMDDSKDSGFVDGTPIEKEYLRKWTPLCDCETRPMYLRVGPHQEAFVFSHQGGKIMVDDRNSHVAQVSDLMELNKPWVYEHGGKKDTLQPITGWWVIRTKEGTYGKDPDVPDAEFDSDAETFDKDLAYNGVPIRQR